MWGWGDMLDRARPNMRNVLNRAEHSSMRLNLEDVLDRA